MLHDRTNITQKHIPPNCIASFIYQHKYIHDKQCTIYDLFIIVVTNDRAVGPEDPTGIFRLLFLGKAGEKFV